MHLYLLRHGQTLNNIQGITQDVSNDIDLTDTAKQDIIAKAPAIVNSMPGNFIVMVSELRRAISTAMPIIQEGLLQKRSSQIIQSPLLNEVHLGSFGGHYGDYKIDGLTMADYRQKITEYYCMPMHKRNGLALPNGESMQDIDKRCYAIICQIVAYKAMGKIDSLVMVCHNRIARHLLVMMQARKPEDMFSIALPHNELYPIDPNYVLHNMT